MNYWKYAYDSDLHSKNYVLSCNNAIFSFQNTKRKSLENFPPLIWKFFSSNYILEHQYMSIISILNVFFEEKNIQESSPWCIYVPQTQHGHFIWNIKSNISYSIHPWKYLIKNILKSKIGLYTFSLSIQNLINHLV